MVLRRIFEVLSRSLNESLPKNLNQLVFVHTVRQCHPQVALKLLDWVVYVNRGRIRQLRHCSTSLNRGRNLTVLMGRASLFRCELFEDDLSLALYFRIVSDNLSKRLSFIQLSLVQQSFPWG